MGPLAGVGSGFCLTIGTLGLSFFTGAVGVAFAAGAAVAAFAAFASGVLLLILVLLSSGGGGLRSPFFPLDVGTVMVSSAGSFSFLTSPLLRDLDFAFGVAGAAAGSDAALGGGFVLMLRDLDFAFGVAGAAEDDDDAGPGCSSFLLLDLAGLADAARVDSNLDAIGAESIFGALSPLGTDTGLLFIASALLSAFGLIGSIPTGGGCRPVGGGKPIVPSFRCADLPRCNLSIVSRRLGFVFCCGFTVWTFIFFVASPLGYRPRPLFPSAANLATYDWSAVSESGPRCRAICSSIDFPFLMFCLVTSSKILSFSRCASFISSSIPISNCCGIGVFVAWEVGPSVCGRALGVGSVACVRGGPCVDGFGTGGGVANVCP